MHRVQKTIGELTYDRDVPVLRARDPVGRALDAMCRRPCEAVLVVEDNRVVASSPAATSSFASPPLTRILSRHNWARS